MASTNPGNFANRPHEEVVALAHKGGLAAHGIVEEPSSTTTTSTNPGNFANRPHDEVVELARKGGLASHNTQEKEEVKDEGKEEVYSQVKTRSSGVKATGNTNPGNFANRDVEEVKAIASKGGLAAAEKRREAEEEKENIVV